MASSSIIGKLDAEIECKSNADKIWPSIRDFIKVYNDAFPPGTYTSVQVLEGDGVHPGSVRLIQYGPGSPIEIAKEKIEIVDDEERIYGFSSIGGDLLKYYKSFKASVQVFPNKDEQGSLLKWNCEYEKLSEDAADPTLVKQFVIQGFKHLDQYSLTT
ncbi:MLP-like protein 423 [Cannabis sativa]|uniref:MLP-like protein 423 n=1 Tax=Cannabis sativa TaxID=3483 RepID=UPI0029CA1D92|nr:MLP-like protein 423 [Cannabis sativa]